jgi:hypothetical protein
VSVIRHRKVGSASASVDKVKGTVSGWPRESASPRKRDVTSFRRLAHASAADVWTAVLGKRGDACGSARLALPPPDSPRECIDYPAALNPPCWSRYSMQYIPGSSDLASGGEGLWFSATSNAKSRPRSIPMAIVSPHVAAAEVGSAIGVAGGGWSAAKPLTSPKAVRWLAHEARAPRSLPPALAAAITRTNRQAAQQ